MWSDALYWRLFIIFLIKEGDGLMDWDRIGAWFWTVIAFFFILGFVLQSFPIVLTVMVLALLVMWIKK